MDRERAESRAEMRGIHWVAAFEPNCLAFHARRPAAKCRGRGSRSVSDPTETSSVLFCGPSSLLVVCKGGGATAALPLAPKGDLDDILSRVQR
jgi:hypothetical protein